MQKATLEFVSLKQLRSEFVDSFLAEALSGKLPFITLTRLG